MSGDVAPPSAPARRWTVSAWALLAAAVPLALYIATTPWPGATIGYLVGVAVCVVAGAAGVSRNVGAGHRRPWLLILAAQGLSVVSESINMVVKIVGGAPNPVLTLVPAIFLLCTYALLTGGVLDLVRRSRAADDRPARMDALLVGVGASLVVWSLWIERWFAGDDPRWQSLFAAVLPLIAALLLVTAMPMLVLGRARTPALWLFTTGGAAVLVADMLLATRGWFVSGPGAVPLNVIGAVMLIADAGVAACMLHPTVGVLTQRVASRSRFLDKGRIAAISAALCVPTVLGLAAPPAGKIFALVRAALSLGLIAVVVVRVVQANNARAQAEQQVRWRAEHDPLTGLPNRDVLTATVEDWTGGPGPARVSVLLLDLDRFKQVNDHWGHGIGDELLRAVAGRITALVRAEDLVCRVGGDEFTVALTAPPGEPVAETLAGRLLAALSVPVNLSVGSAVVTASIGIAHAEGRGGAVALFRDADTAMYRAKESGRNRFAVFDTSLGERIQRRFTLENALQGALEDGQLAVHYQPLVHLATDQVHGYEALMRWTHPDLGAVSPVEFIPVAEDTGLIVDAGAWLLEEAAAQVGGWRANEAGLHVSVNLAVRQLREPGLADRVRDILVRTALPPEGLWLEITESGFMEDPETCLRTLYELRDLGITLCIDDFGTGYSSLSYLQRLPIAIVKIDRSFVSGVGDGGPNEPIVRSVLAMSHALGHRVVAEGVETVTQRDWLRVNGCDFGQGWLYGKPLPATQQHAARAVAVPGGR